MSSIPARIVKHLEAVLGPKGFKRPGCVGAWLTRTPLRIRRFGNYEVNLIAGEVRKRGLKLSLSGQPFEILRLLLERAGDVVTREELRAQLWADDTYVDFDHGLNAAVNKLRETLGDSAHQPRFLETLPRRGYRFIAPVLAGLARSNPSVPALIAKKVRSVAVLPRVVEGSVLRIGDRVRITAELVHGPSDTHVWAERYDRDLRDVLTLQAEVAGRSLRRSASR